MYIPPFTISSTAINRIAEISAQMERFAIRLEQSDGLRLRKANRIKTPLEKQFGITFGKEFGIKFGIKFGDNEKQLLLSLNSNPGMTAQDLADSLSITKRAVEKQIKKLRELNVLTRQGSAKNGSWVINRDASE